MNIQEEVAWGTILADAARHIAMALAQEGIGSEATLVREIKAAFIAELSAPSSAASGGFGE